MQLDVENEVVRRDISPALDHPYVWYRVERGIDLHHVEMLRIPPQPFAGFHSFRVPPLNESGIGPARGADQNFAGAAHDYHSHEQELLSNFAGFGLLCFTDRDIY